MVLIALKRRLQQSGLNKLVWSITGLGLLFICFITFDNPAKTNISEIQMRLTNLNISEKSRHLLEKLTTNLTLLNNLFIPSYIKHDNLEVNNNILIDIVETSTKRNLNNYNNGTYIKSNKPGIVSRQNINSNFSKQVPIRLNQFKKLEDQAKKGRLIRQQMLSKRNITIMKKKATELKNALQAIPKRLKKKPGTTKRYGEDFIVKQTWTREMAEARKKVFEERGNTLRKVCKNMNWENKYFEPSLNYIYYRLRWASEYNLVWCPIFKAASTTWVKNFLSLAGETKVFGSLHGRVRNLYPPPENATERQQFLLSATKLIIVRHPLDRLLSAYRDKMLRIIREDDPYRLMQIKIAETYPDPYIPPTTSTTTTTISNNNKTSNGSLLHPSFNQFLLRVLDDLSKHVNRKGKPINLHWRPYWTTCAPCQLNYDIIAKVETLATDQEYIIHETELDGLAYNAHTHSSTFDHYTDTAEATKAYFSKVPRKLLREIVHLYSPDFEIFNYTADAYMKLTVSL